MLDKLAEIDELTKLGKRQIALSQIENLRLANLPHQFLPMLARLAHRNAAYLLALRILYPVIRQENEGIGEASAEALTVYSNALINIGALEEAKHYALRAKTFTECKLVKAFICFADWDYQQAIPHLKSYVTSKDLTPYQIVVGKVNLVAALISIGSLKQGRELLDGVIENLESESNKSLLLGNCYELSSQIEIQEGRNEIARKKLKIAHDILEEFSGRYLLYVKKWEAILNLIETNPKSSSYDMGLLRVRNEAAELCNWETIRDCDFQFARLTDNRALLDLVFYGTPYRGFKNRILTHYKLNPSKLSEIVYCPDDILSTPSEILWDLKSFSDVRNSGVTSLRLVQALTRDIYRRPRMGLIFSSLYPEEKFNPFTSPKRVHHSVRRFNTWVENKKLDLRISVVKGDFRLIVPKRGGIRVSIKNRPQEKWQIQLKFFHDEFGSGTFTARDLSALLKTSTSSGQQIIQKALKQRRLVKISAGRGARYAFSSRLKVKQAK